MRVCFLLFLFFLLTVVGHAQAEATNMRWGIQLGYGTQQTKPFHSLDYDFEQKFVLAHILLKKFKLNKINIDLIGEGGYYLSSHQLVNKWFTTTAFFKDFPEDFQQQMLRKKAIHQIVGHIGVEVYHFINPKTQIYGYAALGPMWVSQETERLASGLAFSDNLGIGVKLKLNHKMWLNTTLVIRHESNANLKFPNSGHNTLSVRTGVVFNLIVPQKALALLSTH